MANTIRARYSCVSIPRAYGECEYWEVTVEKDATVERGPSFNVFCMRTAIGVPERWYAGVCIPAHTEPDPRPIKWALSGLAFTRRSACRRAYSMCRTLCGGMFPEQHILCEHF